MGNNIKLYCRKRICPSLMEKEIHLGETSVIKGVLCFSSNWLFTFNRRNSSCNIWWTWHWKVRYCWITIFFSVTTAKVFMFEHSAANHVNKLRTKILHLYSSYLKCYKGTLWLPIHRSGLITHLPQQRID